MTTKLICGVCRVVIYNDQLIFGELFCCTLCFSKLKEQFAVEMEKKFKQRSVIKRVIDTIRGSQAEEIVQLKKRITELSEQAEKDVVKLPIKENGKKMKKQRTIAKLEEMNKQRTIAKWEVFHVFVDSGSSCCGEGNNLCAWCHTCSGSSYHKKGITREEYETIVKKILNYESTEQV